MKKFIAGLIVGGVVFGAVGAYAGNSVQALVTSAHYTFDGTEQSLPDGYVSLNYGGHMYVPARFVAEQLGAQVSWDANTSTVAITSGGGGGSDTSSSGGSSSSSGSSTSTDGSSVGHYKFSNYSMSDDGYNTHVIGEVTNNDTSDHTFSIVVNFYDANGKLLGTATDVITDIAPGQKKSFDAIADNVIQGVNTYSFQIDGEF